MVKRKIEVPNSTAVALREAEKLAAKQNANMKRDKEGRLILDEKIYGARTPSVNMEEELSFMQSVNIIDAESKEFFLNASKGEATLQPAYNTGTTVNLINKGVPIMEEKVETTQEVKTEEGEACPYCKGKGKIEKDVAMTDDEKFDFVNKSFSKRFDGVPNIATMKSWKEGHGRIFILDLGDDAFIYRYLKRQEYKILLASDWVNEDALSQKEKVAKKCILWSSFSGMLEGAIPAGALEMLSDQINFQSMFLDPATVASYTMKI